MACAATRALVYGNPARDEVLHLETSLINTDRCIIRPFTALVYHGAFGAAFWHYAVLIGDNRVLEFGPTSGVVVGRRLCGPQSLLAEARHHTRKCPHADAVAPLVAVKLNPLTHGSPAGGLPWPVYNLVSQRIHWVVTHLSANAYDIMALNCEHVARYVVTGKAVSVQLMHVSRFDPRVIALAPLVRRLAHAYRARRLLAAVVLSLIPLVWLWRLLPKCWLGRPPLRDDCPRPS